MAEDACAGCGAPFEYGETKLYYRQPGYSEHAFCYPSCIEDWIERGCPGEYRIVQPRFMVPETKPGFLARMFNAVVRWWE